MTDKRAVKVLLVDDDIDFLDLMKLQLERAGMEVETCESEAQARERLDRGLPDLAVLDLMMERQDAGFALAHRIKSEKADLPVILVTGVTAETGLLFGKQEEGERSWIKADVILAKPLRFEQLKGEIDRLLELA